MKTAGTYHEHLGKGVAVPNVGDKLMPSNDEDHDDCDATRTGTVMDVELS